MRDGTLERIFRKWNVWNDDQPALYRAAARRRAGRRRSSASTTSASVAAMSRLGGGAALPAVAAARGGRHARAVVPGDGAGGRARRADRHRARLRRPPRCACALTGYVELMRGTPVLLQLFVLYYGLAAAIRLPAFVAALLGLALNYAAYESEIYRGALEAVPAGQLEAARTLGLQRAAGADAGARPAGVPARAGADDQRLRRAAQGLVARLGADRRRADEADADLRHQPRQLGDSRARCARRSTWRCRCRWRRWRGGSSGDGRRRRA